MAKNIKPAICSMIAIASVLSGGQALAQDNSEDSARQNDPAIVVTGTRIRGAEAPTGSSVISIDRAFIEDSTAVSVDNIVREVPQIFNLGVTDASRDTPGGSSNIVYGNGVNLRGIGPYATLVLVDGHRATSNTRSVEPSVLPSLALERVEIVPDGASAVYGSDAIAGVVNLVLRRNYDGFQVTGQYGSAENYEQYSAGAAFGKTWDSGQFFIAGEYSFRGALNGDDRAFYRSLLPDADYRTTLCNPGTIRAGGTTYAIPAGGVTPANASSLQPGTTNLCDSLQGEDLLPEQEYQNVAFTFNQNITDGIEIVADGFYAKRDFRRQAESLRSTVTVPSTNAFFVDPTGTGLSSVQVDYNFGPDGGRDNTWGGLEAWQVSAGLNVNLFGDWQASVLGIYGETDDASYATHGLDARGDLPAALASSDPATAFDPFGLNRTNQAVLDSIFDQLFIALSHTEFTGAEAEVSGTVMELPGGALSLAAGYEHQDFSYLPNLQRGAPGTPGVCAPCLVAGVDTLDRQVDSFYGEVLVPLFGSGNATPGFESLSVRAALRHDSYSDVGTTTNPQFGISWEPVNDLTLRASWGTSFRAPLITSLFGNSSALFRSFFPDPTIDNQLRLGLFQSGGNQNLVPEEATTWSAGLDWEPAFAPGARLSLTYFDVEYKNQVSLVLGDTSILFREANYDGTGIILRDAEAAARVADLIAGGMGVGNGALPDPVTLYVDGRPSNLGVSTMNGIDFDFTYGWNMGMNEFAFTIGGTYLTSYEVAQTPSASLQDRLNLIRNPLKLKMRSALNWERGPVGARVVWNHVGGYTNDLGGASQAVSSYDPIDLSLWIQLGDYIGGDTLEGWRLGFFANNLFDQDPPYVNAIGGYDPTAASPIGRIVGVNTSIEF